MSTKTSLKRVALIAVSALTLGFVVAAPSSAGTDITFTKLGGALVQGSGTSTDPFTIAVGTAVTTEIFLASGTPSPVGAGASSIDATTPLPSGITYTDTTGKLTVSGAVVPQAATAYTLTLASPSSKTGTFYLKIVASLVGGGTVYQPWRALSPTGTFDDTTGDVAIEQTVAAVTDYVAIETVNDIPSKAAAGNGNYFYLEVTGSTFRASTISGTVANGSLVSGSTAGTATQLAMPQDGNVWTSGAPAEEVHIHTPASGTVTVKFIERSVDSLTSFVTLKVWQTITITATAPGTLNAAKSTATITGVGSALGVGSKASGVVVSPIIADLDCDTPALWCADQDVLAPAAVKITGGAASIAGTAKAVIKVDLTDSKGLPLIGTLPSVGASISGPGTLSLSTTDGLPNKDGSTGRLLVAPAGIAAAEVATNTTSPFRSSGSTFYINVFSDGTAGVSTVSIWVNGSVWKTKSLSFYGAPTKLAASQNHKVLAAGKTTGGNCTTVAACPGLSVATSYLAQVAATDAAGVAVPYLSYTPVVDKTVITASAATTTGDVTADSLGATWFSASTAPEAKSGDKGTVSFETTLADGTTKLASNTLTFAIGGAPVAVTMGLASGASTEVGAKSSLVFTDKDAAGNAAYDTDVTPLGLKSNVALVVGTATSTAGTALPNTIAMIGGTGTVTFYNPLVPGNVTISGLAAGLIPISTTFTVKNSVVEDAINAAADAAAEAIDAANAATDAANLAAEAADAATVAAEEARDAADAATAAIEELATQVASLIAALQAQIKTLANTVAKIAKKVKA